MNVTIYTKNHCPNCVAAKHILQVRGIKYTEVDIETGDRFANFVANLIKRASFTTPSV